MCIFQTRGHMDEHNLIKRKKGPTLCPSELIHSSKWNGEPNGTNTDEGRYSTLIFVLEFASYDSVFVWIDGEAGVSLCNIKGSNIAPMLCICETKLSYTFYKLANHFTNLNRLF